MSASLAPPRTAPGPAAGPGSGVQAFPGQDKPEVSGRILIIVENIPASMDHRVM